MNDKPAIVLKRLMCLLPMLALVACAQLPSSQEAFEAKLTDFKYSNYPLLPLKKDQSEPTIGVALGKIRAFVSENAQAIRQYQTQRLEKHRQDALDLSAYTEDTDSLFATRSPTSLLHSARGAVEDVDAAVFLGYLAIQPDTFLLTSANSDYMISLRDEGVPFTAIGMRAVFTAPKPRTVKLQEGIYRIAWDFYSKIYVADFRLADSTFDNLKVYTRKPDGANPAAATAPPK